MSTGESIQVLMIEAIGRCNATCSYCPRGVGALGPDSNHALSPEVLEKALELARQGSSKAVFLHHRGEPFLHPDLPMIVRRVRDNGLFAFLSTNLISVTESKVRKVLEAGINEIQMHLSAGATRLPLNVLLQRAHMVRRLNWEIRNNGCKVELNYGLTSETKDQALARLALETHFDETWPIYFFRPQPWPELGLMQDKGVNPASCNWYKTRSCAILANGDVVICCLDQWGRSRRINIMEVDRLQWDHLQDRTLCHGCEQHADMTWLGKCLSTPDWLERRLAIDSWTS